LGRGRKLSHENNVTLNEPITEVEVKNAMDCMVKNRALGPDEIPV
jgi:hypothetical protein